MWNSGPFISDLWIGNHAITVITLIKFAVEITHEVSCQSFASGILLVNVVLKFCKLRLAVYRAFKAIQIMV